MKADLFQMQQAEVLPGFVQTVLII